MTLKTGSLMFLVTELFELNFGILSFFTILERNSKSLLFKIWMSSSFHFQLDLFFFWTLISFYCFPKFLIIYNIFLFRILVIFFSFFQERHTFIPLFYIKLVAFFCFLSLNVASQPRPFHYFS